MLDLRKMDSLTSAGLRTIIKITKQLESCNGRFIVCSLSEHKNKIFKISGFDYIIEIAPDLESARKQLGSCS